MALPADMYSRFRERLPELLKFGVVGGIGAVVDLGGAALLYDKYRVGPLEAKAASTAAATVVTYLGSRFWTFKERENQAIARETMLFVVLNVIGLAVAEVVVGFVTDLLGLRSHLEYNAASVLGTGLGTVFRYFAYRKWVFLSPAGEPALPPVPAAGRQPLPDYPPWDLDPAYATPARAYPSWQPAVEHPSREPAPAERPGWQPVADRSHWQSPLGHPAAQPAAGGSRWEPVAGRCAWEPAVWEPAERSREPAAEGSRWESTAGFSQPWPGNPVIQNGPVASPRFTAAEQTGLDVNGFAQSGPRSSGRHRKQ